MLQSDIIPPLRSNFQFWTIGYVLYCKDVQSLLLTKFKLKLLIFTLLTLTCYLFYLAYFSYKHLVYENSLMNIHFTVLKFLDNFPGAPSHVN